ncbi:MAG: hypothetical protein UT13_C0001G0636 [Candidatus Pacebacteria bacterium GW2011_GWF2_38_9]|nr:MAG: hypothetical protein US01_C0001G0664 [candidate division TM6 bacterium GW2011_GWF2_28_16]KKQ88989.1 MAG: hypothetical protein UT13_C0001G0636 [Candidatus Pacebacteria bacterium GW2011_GWF2_38_9]HAZ73165.1 hypothetical protein [Candidatus Paceibacterota bacterium]
MQDINGEISQPFAPGIYRKLETAAGSIKSLFESKIKTESSSSTVEERANTLLQLLLDKVELQVDIARRATTIVDALGLDGSARQRKLQELKSLNNQSSINENKNSNESQLSAANINEADIVSGKLSMSDLMKSIKTTPKTEGINSQTEQENQLLAESKRQLSKINEQAEILINDTQVVEHYQNMHQEKLKLYRKVREAASGKKAIRDIEIMQERLARQVFLNKRTFSPAEEAVTKQNQLISKAIEKRIADLISDPEVFDLMRWRQLREYQIGLKKDRFAETPSRTKMLAEIRQMWSEGRKVLATGPTGSGKTELFFHASRSLLGSEPERATGHELLTSYEIYGKATGKGFEPGPLTRAIDNNKPFVLDEINLVPNKILMRLKTDLNARPGQEITIQEENGVRHQVKDNFVVGATANVKSEKHPDREKLDPALVRMFEPLPVDYLPPEELHDMMLALLMDIKGGIQLSSKDDLAALAELCMSTTWTQKAYQGYEVELNNGDKLYARGGESTGKIATLREAVLDPGKALDMVNGWDDSRLKGKTLREHINAKIIQFVKNENFPEEDRYHLIRIFALNEFLKGVDVNELGISGLDQATLDAWNGFTGRKVKAGDLYLDANKVAKIDPFGTVRRPDGSDVDDLLGEDETEEMEDEDIDEENHLAIGIKAFEQRRREKNQSTQIDPEAKEILDQLDKSELKKFLKREDKYQIYPDKLNDIYLMYPSTLEEIIRKYREIFFDQDTQENIGNVFDLLKRFIILVKEIKQSNVNFPKDVMIIAKKTDSILETSNSASTMPTTREMCEKLVKQIFELAK